MKKILVSLLALSLINPAIAEEIETPAEEQIAPEDEAFASVDEATSDKAADNEIYQVKSNKLPKGLQFGLGLSAVPGHNWFVGYANKDFESFWWKRLGGRLDLTTPMTITAKATMYDNVYGDGYVIEPEAALWFANIEIGEEEIDVIEIDDRPLSLDGANVNFALKNKNFGALVDFYPFGNTWFLGGLRTSFGYYTGELSANVNAYFPNDVDFGAQNIGNGNDELKFRIKRESKLGVNMNWKYSGPYAGLGFDLGILWGAKIYMDAGVVFTKPMKAKESDFKDKNIVVEGCYAFNGGDCAKYSVLLDGMTKPNVTEVVGDVVSDVLAGQVQGILETGTYTDPNGNNYDYSTEINDLKSKYPELASVDMGAITQDMLNFLTKPDAAPAAWIDDLISANTDSGNENIIGDTIADIRVEVSNAISGQGGSDIQDEIDRIWGDYEEQKRDAIEDINDSMKDFEFMPMVKIGFMFRF